MLGRVRYILEKFLLLIGDGDAIPLLTKKLYPLVIISMTRGFRLLTHSQRAAPTSHENLNYSLRGAYCEYSSKTAISPSHGLSTSIQHINYGI